MFKLSIFLIAILFAVGLNSENFAQRRYNYRSYKPKSFSTSYKSSNTTKYSKRPTTYKQPNLRLKSSHYTAKNKFRNKVSYRPKTKLNFPRYTRNSASISRKYKSRYSYR